MNFFWILKTPTQFYFEIQYFNFDWKITITLLHSHRNTEQWQVRLRSVLFRVRISNSPLFPFNSSQPDCSPVFTKHINNRQKKLRLKLRCTKSENLPTQESCSMWAYTLTNVILHFTVKKVKVAYIRLPSVWFRSWSRFLTVSLQVAWIINPTVGCHYFPPGLQLPPQPLTGLLPLLLLGEQRHNGCEQFA